VIDCQVLAQVRDRQRRADALRQQVDELLDETHLADSLEIPEVLTNHSRQSIPLPDPVRAFVLAEERLRESAEPEQRIEVRPGRFRVKLSQRERVQAEVAVPVGERVAALPVVVEPRRPVTTMRRKDFSVS